MPGGLASLYLHADHQGHESDQCEDEEPDDSDREGKSVQVPDEDCASPRHTVHNQKEGTSEPIVVASPSQEKVVTHVSKQHATRLMTVQTGS